MNSQELFRLDKKVAIVTGGTSRFGAPMSEGLAEAGAIVIIASRNLKMCESLADSLNQRGLQTVGMQVDLVCDDSIQRLVRDVVNRFGRIDVLVNNAVSRECIGEAEELSRQMIIDSMQVNVAGQLLMTQAVLPVMRKNHGGSIIMISSSSALGAPKFSLLSADQKNPANYMVEKYGMNGLTLWLAAKYGKDNIRVNCLCPGTYNPALFEDDSRKDYVQNFINYCPMGRFMEADEIKGPVVFLASEASSYCTGVLLPVEGGYSI